MMKKSASFSDILNAAERFFAMFGIVVTTIRCGNLPSIQKMIHLSGAATGDESLLRARRVSIRSFVMWVLEFCPIFHTV
jgi:hypothetical protein